MSTFLAVYAASFLSVGTQETIETLFSNTANKVFSETNSDDDVKKYGYYDKLIVDCVYQKPFMSRQPDVEEGCLDLHPVLTNNGLCHSFNGIETEQAWQDSEIVKSFSTIFGRFETQTKNFRGIGQSEGETLKKVIFS